MSSHRKRCCCQFRINELINKNSNGDSCTNTNVYDHNDNFHKRVEIISYTFPLGQDNKKDESKIIIIFADSMLNNTNGYGLSKSKKVSFSSHPSATRKDILSAVEEILKTNPDTLIVDAGINDLTKIIITLKSVKKIREKVKRFSPGTQIAFSNIIYRRNKRKQSTIAARRF